MTTPIEELSDIEYVRRLISSGLIYTKNIGLQITYCPRPPLQLELPILFTKEEDSDEVAES